MSRTIWRDLVARSGRRRRRRSIRSCSNNLAHWCFSAWTAACCAAIRVRVSACAGIDDRIFLAQYGHKEIWSVWLVSHHLRVRRICQKGSWSGPQRVASRSSPVSPSCSPPPRASRALGSPERFHSRITVERCMGEDMPALSWLGGSRERRKRVSRPCEGRIRVIRGVCHKGRRRGVVLKLWAKEVRPFSRVRRVGLVDDAASSE
jgi:hypothetical protein